MRWVNQPLWLRGIIFRHRNHVVDIALPRLSTLDETLCWYDPPDVWSRMRDEIFKDHPTMPPETVSVYFKNEKLKAMYLLRKA